ncbi:SDR family oxidoreductase [Vibrio mexicanus]|uniref:SDR family oxidoreductase n=1 Tax=Vibrio mexicanus TaxID=1004326 RepID=UPI00063C8499|nr:SDR family oxidoreductase [Vibrio mexicanus]
MNIKSAVILITSAGSVLGGTLASHFVNLGARVILCDQDLTSLTQTYQRCKALSNDVHFYQTNDYSLGSIQRLFDFVEEKYQSSPDVVVNNWANSPMPSLIDLSNHANFTQQFSMMASTLFAFGQASAERMRQEHKKGVIVNVISHEDRDLSGFESATSMVAGFTQSWAKQLTPFNIRVGGVVPALSHSSNDDYHWAEIQDELIRNTEYIVSNEYFSGRVMAAQA